MDKDYMLTLALTIYEDGMHDCGYPRHVCMHPENDGMFELPDITTVCHANAAVERENKDRSKNKSYEPEPGEILTVTYTREGPLPAIVQRRSD